MAQALTDNCSLTYLHLYHNGISAVGGAALATMLRQNTTLQHLNLRSNSMGSSTQTMNDALQLNTGLAEYMGDGGPLPPLDQRKKHWLAHEQSTLTPEERSVVVARYAPPAAPSTVHSVVASLRALVGSSDDDEDEDAVV